MSSDESHPEWQVPPEPRRLLFSESSRAIAVTKPLGHIPSISVEPQATPNELAVTQRMQINAPPQTSGEPPAAMKPSPMVAVGAPQAGQPQTDFDSTARMAHVVTPEEVNREQFANYNQFSGTLRMTPNDFAPPAAPEPTFGGTLRMTRVGMPEVAEVVTHPDLAATCALPIEHLRLPTPPVFGSSDSAAVGPTPVGPTPISSSDSSVGSNQAQPPKKRFWSGKSWKTWASITLAPVLIGAALSELLLSSEDEPAATAAAESRAGSKAKPAAAAVRGDQAEAASAPTAPQVSSPASAGANPAASSRAERDAIDALAGGDLRRASQLYEQLSGSNPAQPAFREAARILREKVDQRAAAR